MNLGQIRSLVSKRYDHKLDSKYSTSFLNTLINDALKEFCAETLCLEAVDDSLTYSSSKDGFVLPSDFIKAKYVEWELSSGYTKYLEPLDVEEVKKRRNRWADDDDSVDNDSLIPSGFAIFNGALIIDSYSQTSPKLYYYKYDAELNSDDDEPNIESRYHKYLADYVCFEIDPANTGYLQKWEYGLNLYNKTKQKLGGRRTKYVGL